MAISPKELFNEAIKSPETRRGYNICLERFKRDTKVNITKKSKAKQLQSRFIEYIIQMKKEGRSYSSMNNMVAALQKYCEVLDIEVTWKKVRSYMPEHTCDHTDKPYTTEQLRKLIEIANPREKAIILFMLSSGCRVGALPVLRVGDLKRVGDLYQVRVYATSVNDAYTTFCSVEAATAIDITLGLRRHKGETITDNSPLFRADIDDEVKPVSTQVIFQRIYQLLVKVGIRKPSDNKHKRQGTMLTHSFRKIANTAFVKAGIKPVVVEMLLGHTTGLQANYLRLSDEELLQEYQKAQSLLTIGQEKQLLKQVAELEVKAADVEDLKAIVMRQRAEIDQLKEKNKTRTENLDHKEGMLEFMEKQYFELKARMDAYEGKPPFKPWTEAEEQQNLAEVERMKREEPELYERIQKWEADRKEREKAKTG